MPLVNSLENTDVHIVTEACEVSAAPHMAAAAARPLPQQIRWLLFSAIVLAEVLDVLDTTIANVAAPSLMSDLQASHTEVQWAIGAYVLAMGAGLMLGGRLGDHHGSKFMFILGMAGFGISSLACALSPTMSCLIAARSVQGLTGALLLPQGFVLLRRIFDREDLPRAMGILGPILATASVVGPVLGGWVVEANFLGSGWRSAFLLNAPISLGAIWLVHRHMPADGQGDDASVDWMGACALGAGLFFLALGLIRAGDAGFGMETVASGLMAALMLMGFGLLQGQRARDGLPPLMPAGLLRNRTFKFGVYCMAVFFSCFIGMQLVFALYVQAAHGLVGAQAGMAMLPFSVGVFVGAGLAGGLLLQRWGRLLLVAAGVLQLLGVVWALGLLESKVVSLPALTAASAVGGLGGGAIVVSLITIVMDALPDAQAGSGSGVLATTQSISAAAGISALSSLYFLGALRGEPDSGYQSALWCQVAASLGFLVLIHLLPVRVGMKSSHAR